MNSKPGGVDLLQLFLNASLGEGFDVPCLLGVSSWFPGILFPSLAYVRQGSV